MEKPVQSGQYGRVTPTQDKGAPFPNPARQEAGTADTATPHEPPTLPQEERVRPYGREIAAAILEGQPLSEIARLITDIVARNLRVERVGLYLRDSRGIVVPFALRNISAEYGKDITRLIPTSPIAHRARATKLPVFARSVQQDPQVGPELRALYCREDITSLLIIMLQYEQRVAGMLVVYPEAERAFTPQELSIFQSLADMATLGIALSQQLEQQREFAMLEERNRLAREIHDTVAQSLAALILQIETTQIVLQRSDAAAAGEMLTQAHGLAKNALEDTRRAVRGLAAATAYSLSPAQAIAQEARQLEAEAGIKTQFILTGEEQILTPDQRASLLRIAQEALTNARKHAQPQRVRVGMQFGMEDVMLLVEDDGLGFDVQTAHAPGPESGYGLFGMEERAQLVGADLQIDSTPGWGTRIRVVLPYRPSSPLAHSAAGERKEEGEKGRRGEEETGNRVGAQFITPAPGLLAAPNTGLLAAPNTQHSTPNTQHLNTQHPTPNTQHPIRVLIVDDHALARQGIRALLHTSPDVVVVGEAEDGGQAVAEAMRLQPDVVLMDLQMPRVDGLEGLRRLQIRLPDVPVVMLTTFQTEKAVADAFGAGARGFLLKDTDSAELLAAVRAAKRGDSLLAHAITDRLASLTSPEGRAVREAHELNAREQEILELLARGARNKEIATALFIAPKTVEYHLSNIFTKLGVSNRTEAARQALEQGLVPPLGRSLK